MYIIQKNVYISSFKVLPVFASNHQTTKLPPNILVTLLCKYLLCRQSIYPINKVISLFTGKYHKILLLQRLFLYLLVGKCYYTENHTFYSSSYHHFSSKIQLKDVKVDSNK